VDTDAEAGLRASIPNASAGSRFYLPELDTLRFFAAAAVYAHHFMPGGSYLPRYLPRLLFALVVWFSRAGWVGVPIFFCLSAYLLTALMLREREATGAVAVKAFYARRILRIWPLYFFFIAFASVLGIFVASQRHPLGFVAAFLLLAGNFALALKPQTGGIIVVLWTVSIEEQFYLAWPLVVRRIGVRGLMAVAAGLFVVASISRGLMLALSVPRAFILFSTMTCLDPMAVGILMAAILRNRSPRIPVWGRIAIGAAAIVGLITAANLLEINNRSFAEFALISYPMIALCCGLLLLATIGSAAAGLRFMRNPTLVYLGKISYGIYVYQLAAMQFARYLAGPSPGLVGYTLYAIGAASLDVALAAASYRWLESPFLRLKENFTRVRSRPV